MGKYDQLPTIIAGIKQDITRKEEELAVLKESLKVLSAKLPGKPVVAPKVVKTTKSE